MEVLDNRGPAKQIPAETEVSQSSEWSFGHLTPSVHGIYILQTDKLAVCDLGKVLSRDEPQLLDEKSADLYTSEY